MAFKCADVPKLLTHLSTDVKVESMLQHVELLMLLYVESRQRAPLGC